MSAIHSACIAHRSANANGNGYHDEGVDVLDSVVDANGDVVKPQTESKVSCSSEEDIGSSSSNNDEDEEIIYVKTR